MFCSIISLSFSWLGLLSIYAAFFFATPVHASGGTLLPGRETHVTGQPLASIPEGVSPLTRAPALPPSLAAPQQVKARASLARAMAISWQPVEGAGNYTIEKSSGGPEGPYKILVTVPAEVRYYRETGLGLGQTVHYRLKATAGSQDSPYTPATGTTNPDDLVRIMPLGDSNTEGGSGETVPAEERIGYRLELYRQLVLGGREEGYQVDLVGSEQTGQAFQAGFLQANGFALDLDHAGFGGARDEDIAALLREGRFEFYGTGTYLGPGGGPYLDRYNPDIILLHIGTNSVSGSATAMEDVRDILDEVEMYEERAGKETLVIVARIIQRVCYVDGNGTEQCPYPIEAEKTGQYNQMLETYVQGRDAAGDRLLLVDMEQEAGITYTYTYDGGDMADPLHPTQRGYDKMAQVWLEALASPAVPLPIELMSFEARVAGMEILLNWSTASEQGNSHFVVERMVEGMPFTKIGTVPGAGNSSLPLHYSYRDASAPAGQLYYRLRQVDNDGTYTFSHTVTTRRNVPQAPALRVFPNPSNGSGSVHLVATGFNEGTHVQLSLVDALGRRIYREELRAGTQGELSVQVPLPPILPGGLYRLELSSSRGIQTGKLLVR